MISNKLFLASLLCSIIALKAENASQQDLKTNAPVEEEMLKQSNEKNTKEEKLVSIKPTFDINAAYNAIKENDYEKMLMLASCREHLKILSDEAIKRGDLEVARKVLYFKKQNKQTEKIFKNKCESSYAREKRIAQFTGATLGALGSFIGVVSAFSLLHVIKVIRIVGGGSE